MKSVGNHTWNIAVNSVLFLILYTLFTQILTVELPILSLILSGVLTLLGKAIIAKVLNNIEVDFNFLRELVTVLIGITIILVL